MSAPKSKTVGGFRTLPVAPTIGKFMERMKSPTPGSTDFGDRARLRRAALQEQARMSAKRPPLPAAIQKAIGGSKRKERP